MRITLRMPGCKCTAYICHRHMHSIWDARVHCMRLSCHTAWNRIAKVHRLKNAESDMQCIMECKGASRGAGCNRFRVKTLQVTSIQYLQGRHAALTSRSSGPRRRWTRRQRGVSAASPLLLRRAWEAAHRSSTACLPCAGTTVTTLIVRTRTNITSSARQLGTELMEEEPCSMQG